MNGRNYSDPLPGWQEINRQVRLAEQRRQVIEHELNNEEPARKSRPSRLRRQARTLAQALVAALSWLW